MEYIRSLLALQLNDYCTFCLDFVNHSSIEILVLFAITYVLSSSRVYVGHRA